MSLKNFVLSESSVILAVLVLVSSGCSAKDTSRSGATSSNAAPPLSSIKVPPPPPLPAGKHAAIIAEPNPIKVCDDSGLGITAVAFTIEPPVYAADVRVGSPGGDQLASKGESGYATTGKWVSDGTVFYLQDVTGGKTLTAENTLATVTAKVTREGCP